VRYLNNPWESCLPSEIPDYSGLFLWGEFCDGEMFKKDVELYTVAGMDHIKVIQRRKESRGLGGQVRQSLSATTCIS